MKKIIGIIFSLALFSCGIFGQTDEINGYVDEGIKLHDSGDYKGAIGQYEKALQLDRKSPLANYEIAMTYLAVKEYEKAIEHCRIVIAGNSDHVLPASILEGSALDLLGKPREAIAAYKKAIRQFPDHHLLYYNLALTLYNQNEVKDSEEALQQALKIKPAHASSHMLLGYVMRDQNHRVKSLLAFYNFLLLEPKGNRAKSALGILNSELKKGVTRNSDKSTSVAVSASDEKDEFSRAEFMLSLLEASKDLEKNIAKTEYELFSDNNKSFFAVLGESKKASKGFWWNYYVDFFYAMYNNNHVDAFSYYISQAKDDEKIAAWLKNNQERIDSFLKWFLGYKRGY